MSGVNAKYTKVIIFIAPFPKHFRESLVKN